MSDWWTDGAMVNSGLPGDEGFVGDAATEADAQRIVDAHNEARIQEPAAGPPWFPEAGDKAEAPLDPECIRCGMLRSEHDPFIGNTSGERSGCTFPKYGTTDALNAPIAGDKAEAPHSLDGVTALDGGTVTPEDVAYVRRMQAGGPR